MSTSSTGTDGAVGALIAVSRLLAATTEGSASDIHAALIEEACACFGARAALVLVQEPGRRLRALDAEGPQATDFALGDHAILAEMLDRRLRLVRPEPDRMSELASLVSDPPSTALLLLLRSTERLDGVLMICDPPTDAGNAADAEVATAFADAGAAALERLRAVSEHERQARQQLALARAAKCLNESLDLDTVLDRICREAAAVMDADFAAVYRGSATEPLVLSAGHALPPEATGWTMPPGTGLAGKVVRHGRAMLTNDYPRIAGLPDDAPLPPEISSAMAAPMEWDGNLQGVLTVGYLDARTMTQADLSLLETVAELAATASANASAHAGLAHVARTDGLTGCLNHAALHDGLAREIERALRSPDTAVLSLVLIDLDDFKQINETHGHLTGDEVLRRVGQALLGTMRPYDLAARYGGDEFALVTVDADRDTAVEIAGRALEQLGTAVADLLPDGGAAAGTAGVAQWGPGLSATELIARADRALLFAKQEGFRGGVHTFAGVPVSFEPGSLAQERGAPRDQPATPERAEPARDWPRSQLDERLRRRTRQLALANDLGARVSSLIRPEDIQEVAVEELHRAFGFFHASTIRLRPDGVVEAVGLRGPIRRHWEQPADIGLIGRCLRTRRPVLANDVHAEPDYVSTAETVDVRSELVVPLWVGEELFGVIDLEELEPGAFDEDDVALLETVASQVGSAIRGALLYERLERAYLGTAEALAAALEAKDAYTADHARSIVAQAEAVARALGISEDDLRDLRFAAVFHDIGKISVPESILHKPGPLSAAEREVMERHTIVGEQILAPVEFLSDVRVLVRHEHERWDGAGYPDGLAGDAIPLGSRIILVCDALHAMTSDRPYRKAMSFKRAISELRRHAGAQFDPRVVEALLSVLAEQGVKG